MEFSGGGFKSHSSQLSIATSNKLLQVGVVELFKSFELLMLEERSYWLKLLEKVTRKLVCMNEDCHIKL